MEEAQEEGDICIIMADLHCCMAETKGFPGNSAIKNPLAMQETRVPSSGQEDLLEEGRATHSGILACRIPWTERPGGLQSMGSQKNQRLGGICVPGTRPTIWLAVMSNS